MKDLTEVANVSAFRNKFELVRSFDLEDDMEFCPNLCSDSDVSPSLPMDDVPPVPWILTWMERSSLRR